MTEKPTVPIFDLKDTFDADIAIGDHTLPVHVKRFRRGEWIAFKKRFDALMAPRGAAELSAEEKEKRAAEQLAFADEAISSCITLDAGFVRDRGQDVTDGAGLVEMFHAREDVLVALLSAIYVKNMLSGVIRKNSNSPRASDPGSGPSNPGRGGEEQGSIAGNAAPNSSANSAAATDESASAEDGQSSSGTTREHDDAPKVH